MKEDFSHFSAGKVKRKYAVIEKTHSRGRVVLMALLGMALFFTIIFVFHKFAPVAITLGLLSTVAWHYITKRALSFTNTGDYLVFDKGCISLENERGMVWTTPLNQIKTLSLVGD